MTAPGVLRSRPALALPPPWSPEPPRQAWSSNGHCVVLMAVPGRHSVAVELVADGGAASEPTGHEGSAALAAGLLGEGTDQRSAAQWRAALEQVGAHAWAGVTAAALRVSITAPTAALDGALGLVAESLTSRRGAEQALGRLRRQAVAAARQAAVTPTARALLELRARVHAREVRARLPLAGTVDSLTALPLDVPERQRALALRRPVTVVVSGDLELSTVLRLVDRVLPPPLTPEPSAPPVADAAPGCPHLVWVNRDDLTQCQLLVGAVTVPRDHPDWAALRVGLHAVAGALGSRVDALLREELGVTYGVRGQLHSRAGDALLTIGGGIEARSSSVAIEHIRAVLAHVADQGLTPAETDAAASYLAGSAAVRLADPRPLVELLADRVEAALPLDGVDAELAALRAVTSDEASAALARWAAPESLSLAAVGPERARPHWSGFEVIAD